MSLYTIGNWSIDRMYTDTITTPKTLSIPDISWSTDFEDALKPKGREVTKNAMEKYFSNDTGQSVFSPESLITGRKPVSDVYSNTEVDITSQLPQKGGHKIWLSGITYYQGTNSVSGQEILIPMKGTFSLEAPDTPIVTQTLIEDFLKREIAKMFGTTETNAAFICKLLRGDLNPTT